MLICIGVIVVILASLVFCTFPGPKRYIEKVQNAASALASQCIVRIFF